MVQLTGQLAYLQQAHLLCQSMQDNLQAAMVGAQACTLCCFAVHVHLRPLSCSHGEMLILHLDKQQCLIAQWTSQYSTECNIMAAGPSAAPQHAGQLVCGNGKQPFCCLLLRSALLAHVEPVP